jgi:hypothetical protein
LPLTALIAFFIGASTGDSDLEQAQERIDQLQGQLDIAQARAE